MAMSWNAPLRILNTRPALGEGAAPEKAADPYLARLVKLVPAEVLAIYAAFKAYFVAAKGDAELTGWESLGTWGWICFFLVIGSRMWGTSQPETAEANPQPVQKAAVVIAAFSFVLWIYANNGGLLWADHWLKFLRSGEGKYGSIAIALWTFIIPWFYKGGTAA